MKQMAGNEKKDVVAIAEQLLANAVGGEWSYAPRMTQARGWSLASTYFESDTVEDQVFAAVEGDADPDTEELLLHTAKFLSKSHALVGALVDEVKRLRSEVEEAKATQVVAVAPTSLDNTLTLRKQPQQIKSTDRRLLPAELRPCPVTGILNRHRRFSYLMPEARTIENLNKFKKTAGESRNALKMQPEPPKKVEAVPPIRRAFSR